MSAGAPTGAKARRERSQMYRQRDGPRPSPAGSDEIVIFDRGCYNRAQRGRGTGFLKAIPPVEQGVVHEETQTFRPASDLRGVVEQERLRR
jgi:polyphosphate kinase 2 (PPK2 family)